MPSPIIKQEANRFLAEIALLVVCQRLHEAAARIFFVHFKLELEDLVVIRLQISGACWD